jgi:arabinose-5-phosphate isomerase
VAPTASLSEVIFEISSKRLGATAVLGQSGNLLGVITDGDLRRMLARNQPIEGLQAQDILTPNPKTIAFDAMAVDALAQMRESSITQLLVLEGDQYRGVVHLHDLLREGLV